MNVYRLLGNIIMILCCDNISITFYTDPPIVTLRLGSTLSDDIKEGDDVYFECQAVANPQWRKLYWLHDVSALRYLLILLFWK